MEHDYNKEIVNDVDDIMMLDEIAFKAMEMFIPICKDDARRVGQTYPEYIAKVSYDFAVAMMHERKKVINK